MSWNNGYETKKFKKEQEQIAKSYRKNGAPEELIKEMYKYDYIQFCKTRSYVTRTEHLDTYEDIPSKQDDIHSRYWWIEEISDPILVKKIKSLSQDDIELLTLFAILDYTQEDIAHMKGCTKQNIQKKIRRIKNFLK